MIYPSQQAVLDKFGPAFDKACQIKSVYLANFLALRACELMFDLGDADSARMLAWNAFFDRLSKRYRAQYQCFDFEVVDYDLYPMPQSWSLLRGPRPREEDLKAGRYVTITGAAQLFGRYQQQAPHQSGTDEIGVSGLNFSAGGAGPESFSQEGIIELANGGRALVVQILSGRSIGCDEYPGGRMTFRKHDPAKKIDRLKLLTEIWQESRQEARRLVAKWQRRYIEVVSEFLGRVRVPVVLVWISSRTPDAWNIDELDDAPSFGAFPQLVDREMVRSLATKCAHLIEISRDDGLPYGFVSRFTHERCPIVRPTGTLLWENDYYPSAQASGALSARLKDVLQSMF